ncbi:MAG: adenosine kinase [Bacteroidetes bacterium]|nr:MAG: adenosine kinase [Bacteroidota bacterium]
MAKVLGIGNSLVDILIRLESDETLDKFSLPKGSMQLVEISKSNTILKETTNLKRQQSSGGSAANTINGLANMGVKTGFIGKIGNDEFGEFFKSDMQVKGIVPKLFLGSKETGRAIGLISPDSERTFATYLGSSIELSDTDLSKELFEDYEFFHIEGYLLQNHALIEQALIFAKQNNLIVSIDFASFNVVEENLEFLTKITKKYVDIVFANEDEAKAFTGEEPRKALDIIAEMCEIAVVKIGGKGSLIKRDKKVYEVGIIEAKRFDTTGAGDLYAAGFLYGLINNMSMNKCGEIGSLLSGKVIEVIGAKMNSDKWKEINNELNIK